MLPTTVKVIVYPVDFALVLFFNCEMTSWSRFH